MKKINLDQWNQNRIETEKKLKELKNAIRSSFSGGSWQQYRELKLSKSSATHLYALRAATHNKQHCPAISKEEAANLFPNLHLPDQEKAA